MARYSKPTHLPSWILFLMGSIRWKPCLGKVEWARCIGPDTSCLAIVSLSRSCHQKCGQTPNGFVGSVEKDKPHADFVILMLLRFMICARRRTAPSTW